eukprot:GHVU01102557.1.p1 GENE.GHVU01102557.1~~GHVU01102557.1.p1  ORF type:complete len:107 (-),score=8.31 GHVU01102557.1:90-410(-)
MRRVLSDSPSVRADDGERERERENCCSVLLQHHRDQRSRRSSYARLSICLYLRPSSNSSQTDTAAAVAAAACLPACLYLPLSSPSQRYYLRRLRASVHIVLTRLND